MVRYSLVALMPLVLACSTAEGQNHCGASQLERAAAHVQDIESSLRTAGAKAGEGKVDWSTNVAPTVTSDMEALKETLGQFSDLVMACEPLSVAATDLQSRLAIMLNANAPEPPEGTAISADDHRYDEILGSYGHNLRIQVRQPREMQGVIEFRYFLNIECGADTMLLVYQAGGREVEGGVSKSARDGGGPVRGQRWVRRLRWQSPPLHSISDAFGDFFEVGYLADSHGADGKKDSWRVLVAHGTPWCSSRFSRFKMDLLEPEGSDGTGTKIWSTTRGYSRGDFAPVMRSHGDLFELRLNDDAMHFDESGFERRVIYRYRLDSTGHPTRINPLGRNAREFMEEWLSAPWDEAREFIAPEAAVALEQVHTSLMPPHEEDRYVRVADGLVRACSKPGEFQVQVNVSEEWLMSKRKPRALPSRYFRLRKQQNGYVVLRAPDRQAAACSGKNLTAAAK